jgi:hypothetical protein
MRCDLLPLFTLLALSACAPNKDDAESTVDASSGSTGSTTNPGATTGTDTTAEPTTADTTDAPTGSGTTSTTAPTTTSTSTTDADTDGDTSADACSPGQLEVCPVTQCIEDWSFECDGCGFEVNDSTCFEIDVGCAWPALACDLPTPCDRVWGQGFATIESLEDDNAAICLLTALRDGTPGRYEVLWGEMGDAPLVYMTIHSGGKDAVLVEWYLECQGCPISGAFRRSGQLALRPDSFFDDCLAMPDTASLTECVFGFVDFTAGQQPAIDYTPPFTTGECTSLDIACPG